MKLSSEFVFIPDGEIWSQSGFKLLMFIDFIHVLSSVALICELSNDMNISRSDQ